MYKLLFICCCLLLFYCVNPSQSKPAIRDYQPFYQKAITFCKEEGINQNYFILIDYAAHSGTNRFIVYDIKNNTVLYQFPVSHGCYSYPWSGTKTKNKAHLSNEFESHASSKGKYLITQRGASQWGIGIKYFLKGLDSSNNNAFARTIVLHSWEKVSNQSIYPAGTPEGWGCPAVSNANMRKLDELLKNQGLPTLLWAID